MAKPEAKNRNEKPSAVSPPKPTRTHVRKPALELLVSKTQNAMQAMAQIAQVMAGWAVKGGQNPGTKHLQTIAESSRDANRRLASIMRDFVALAETGFTPPPNFVLSRGKFTVGEQVKMVQDERIRVRYSLLYPNVSLDAPLYITAIGTNEALVVVAIGPGTKREIRVTSLSHLERDPTADSTRQTEIPLPDVERK